MRAASVSRYGGPGVLEIVDVEMPSPGAGYGRLPCQIAMRIPAR
jgi:NADPH:quinone reductase-like Zn-dependent oxidoreductase